MSAFGSEFVLVDITDEEEHIYKDEVQDGIASCAQEQAEAWVAAAEEEGVESSNALFAREILALTGNIKGQSDRAGAIGCSTRLQPRFQKGAHHYDAIALAQDRQRQAAALVAREKMEALRRELGASSANGYQPYRRLSGMNAPGSTPLVGDDYVAVVADFGSGMSRMGFAGDDSPRSVFPSIVGRPRHCGVMVGMGQKDSYVGDEAQSKRGILTLKYPVHQASVSNWDDLEKLMHHGFFNELRIAPCEVGVLVSVPTTAPRHDIEKYCQVLFETFSVPFCQIVPAATLAVLAVGRDTGLSVEIGDRSFTVSPVIAGAPVEDATISVPLGGSSVTDYLMKICTERGYSFTTTCERDIVRDIKEKLCFVSIDFDKDMQRCASSSELEKSYELPDGQVLTVGNERFRAPEALFQPAFIGMESPGIADVVFHSLMRVQAQYRRDLACNIVLSGGSSLFPGLADRLQKELAAMLPAGQQTGIIAYPERKFGTWIGGSILASLMPAEMWYSSEQYNASGPYAVDANLFEPISSTGDSVTPLPPVTPSTDQEEPSPASDTPKEVKAEEVKMEEELDEEPTRHSDADIVETRPLASPNCAVVALGKCITEVSTLLQTGDPLACAVCGAIAVDRSQVAGASWICDFCGEATSLESEELEELPKAAGPMSFLVQKGVSAATKSAVCPLVIFCMDVSGSMGSAVPGTGLNRLQCMQQAVSTQIRALHRTDPACRVGLVTFATEVDFYQVSSRFFSKKTISGRKFVDQYLSAGNACGAKVRPLSECRDKLLEVVGSLRCLDCTALGPAMAFSIGVAKTLPGSRVILCTDGTANIGVGSLSNVQGSPAFYTAMGTAAKEAGVQVSVITTEGIESGMECLGKTADISSGSVEVAKPSQLVHTLASMLRARAVATDVQTTVIFPPQLISDGCRSFELDNGTVTDHSVISFAYKATVDFREEVRTFYEGAPTEEPAPHGLPVQLQVRYTNTDGDRMLLVLPTRLRVSPERTQAEADVNTEAVALHAIHSSADLAQKGEYSAARVNLISTQRLLQRCMKTRRNQEDYLNFIVQAEKLDQFMREAQAQAALLGSQAEHGVDGEWKRDDEAAKAMYQMKTVSLQSFRSR